MSFSLLGIQSLLKTWLYQERKEEGEEEEEDDKDDEEGE
jgi:hypothetical protein